MDFRALLRISAPVVLAVALASGCSDDPAPSRDDANSNEDDEDETSEVKRDAGRRDAGKADARARPSEDDEEASDEGEEEEEEEDAPPPARDAGRRADAASSQCTADRDCKATSDAGIACCDLKTRMCFMTREDECPAPAEDEGQMPTYN